MTDLASTFDATAFFPPNASLALRVAFAGVDFSLHLPRDFRFELPPDYVDYLVAGDEAPVCAHVECYVELDANLGAHRGALSDVTWRREPGRLLLDNARVQAVLENTGPGRYRAKVLLADTRGCEHQLAMAANDTRAALPEPQAGPALLLRFIAAALIEAEGGLNLHAAAVDMGGIAIAFCGPSGAGKSTACDLCPNARGLAYDQLVVYSVAETTFAWALPWGNSSKLARGNACVLPLGALLRVTRGLPQTTIVPANPSNALFIARDATTVSDASVESEQLRLAACIDLCKRVQVGHIYTVLGQRADHIMRDQLSCFSRAHTAPHGKEIAQWAF